MHRVFNSNMVLFFLDEYQLAEGIPDDLVDANMKTDYHKLTGMFRLFKNEVERKRILEEIMKDNGLETDIVTNFNFSVPFSESDFLSMLFYLGLLTIKEPGRGFDVTLQTPNAVIRNIYYQYYANYLKIDEHQKKRAVRSIALLAQYGKEEMVQYNYLIELKYLKKSDAKDETIAALQKKQPSRCGTIFSWKNLRQCRI